MPDELTIRVAPTIPAIGLIRAMASGLAARLDFSYDQIMDLHIGIDEICARLLAASEDPEALEVVFRVEDDTLSFTAAAAGPVRRDREFLNPWSKRILGAVVDKYEVGERDGRPSVDVKVRRA